MTENKITTAGMFFRRLLPILVFAVSYRQLPLYSSNQNTYFLHGLAEGGMGFLKMDWLTQTADPFPVFSALVNMTVRMFNENIFYFFYMAILAIYIYSILGIACYIYDIGSSKVKYLSYFVLLVALYSGLLVDFLSQIPGMWRLTPFINPDGLLTWGVAEQFLLGPVFQPSTFGVFIVLSIYVFLREKHFMAVACLAVAATFHPAYLLSAAILMGTYLVILLMTKKEWGFAKISSIGAFALVMVMPVLAYNYLYFSPTTSEIANQARHILVDYRIPHHAKPQHWFNGYVLFQIIMIVGSLFLVRRTRLFPILLFPFLAAIILTVVQVVTGSRGLALLFPWRMSVFLVPIASSVILAGIVSAVFRIFDRPIAQSAKILQTTVWVAIIVIGCWGVRRTMTLFNVPRAGLTASAEFAFDTFQAGDLYLIPSDMESFRLAAKVPVFVDFKSHPYRDHEIIEWFERINIADDFFAASAETAVSLLKNISDKYPITHVVMKWDNSIADCEMLHELYRDQEFVVYGIVPPTNLNAASHRP